MSIDWLLVGLRNPGTRYEYTRHNLGGLAVREWFNRGPTDRGQGAAWRTDAALEAEVAQVRLADGTVVTGLLPITFMNQSGRAVARALDRQALPVERVLIVHDDIELPWGAVELKAGGSARGHNGVRSIHQALQTTASPRLLIGVGRPVEGAAVDAYVLQPFTAPERAQLDAMIDRACQAITEFVSTAVSSRL